ncbi:hypothetical protein PTKIN_Ptkin03bG0175100 [Pterospermum kingtungense]
MGTQIPATSDRARTYWTPTMERYFIDLMLEQMHRGNRIGHTFNKQAWTDMLNVFNAKFGSQYDKDVLKSRYTNLWKQFNDVKNLLGQSGFSWDESRQMVVADDYVWNAYIKAHPDAQFYKTKALLNFSDLCFIYAYTTADGRYSRSSHDLDFDDEVQGLNMGAYRFYIINLNRDATSSVPSTNNDRSRTEWNADMDQYFIELMLDQLMVTADDDVWDSYIKAHPHARTYRMKTLPNYNDLALIYGEAIDEGSLSNLPQECDISRASASDGKGSTTAASDRTRTFWTPPMDRYLIDLLLDQVYRGNKLGQTFITQSWIDMITSFNVKFGSHYDKDVLKNRYKHLRRLYNDIKILLEQSGASKAQKTSQEMQKMLSKMASVVTGLASQKGNNKYSTIESAVDALQALPDIDDELLSDGCDLLEDERKAKTFLALDVTLRKKWLLRKLGS